MYTNLHTLPPDKAMFTLYLGLRGTAAELTEEYDIVGPTDAPADVYLVSLVIHEARPYLVERYGPTVEVRGVVNESAAQILYDSRVQGFRPIPVVPTARFLQFFNPDDYDGKITVPYDAFIDLCVDAHDGMGTEEFLDHLTRED